MGIFDDLGQAIATAERAISALGPPPPGDPHGLKLLARQVRAQADRAATAGRLEHNAVNTLDFECPAAKRFTGNVAEVAESLFVGQRLLDQAADAIEREAGKIETAQREHARERKRLLGKIEDLGRQVGRAAR